MEKRTSEKLSLIRILTDLFIVLKHLARAGEVEHSNNCEPTIAEAFGTWSFVTVSGRKSKSGHFHTTKYVKGCFGNFQGAGLNPVKEAKMVTMYDYLG
jgi:hypothetical protein